MDAKKSNLCVAIDVTTKKGTLVNTQREELLEIADQVGPSSVLIKTHIDVIEDFDADLVKGLLELAKKHNFMIFVSAAC